MTCSGFPAPGLKGTVAAETAARPTQAAPGAADAPVASGGWRIAAGFAESPPPEGSARFYAIYEGEAFGNPDRGIIAVLARGHPEAANVKAARDAAQLTVYGFAEGYFGARRTLGPKRAAQLSLSSINAWLHGQHGSGGLAPVSLTALLFQGVSIGVVQAGAALGFRLRGREITPLMGEHGRPQAGEAPPRAIGREAELSVAYDELEPALGEKFLLASGLAGGQIEAAFRLELPQPGCAMLLEVLAIPDQAGAMRGGLADLPLRPPPREGDVWDGFVIGKTIYQGRYTVLKRAHDSIENREVVLKIPLPSMLQDEVFCAGFMREAWIGSTVRGNNVVRYLDLPRDRRSSLYLVMPYYPGETLEKRLYREPKMPLPDGIGIALKLCEAVGDLAAIQIVHRDLKPENVLLLPDNGLKLLDLGLAYLPGIDVRDSIKPGGTLRYMAPELLKGVQANARSEVYALAVTIYRMFAGGAFPFGQREAVPLQRLRPDLPGWLGRIIARGLEQDPAERFADAGELAKALHEGLVHGEADAAPSRFPFTRLQLWQAATLLFATGFLVLLIRMLT